MPVINREPVVWPDDLFDRDVEARPAGQWCAYHVRPRTEKAIARSLRSRGVSYFLPQTERRKRYQRRFVTSHLPIFPGYLFVLGQEDVLRSRFEAKEIIQYLAIDDQCRIERELRSLHRLIRSGQPLTREERLAPGAPVEIICGPLVGLQGHVVKNKGGLKFVLHVQLLQQGVSLEIESAMIEAR